MLLIFFDQNSHLHPQTQHLLSLALPVLICPGFPELQTVGFFMAFEACHAPACPGTHEHCSFLWSRMFNTLPPHTISAVLA